MEIPASLSIGTQVSAKYKGAFCEAKVKSVNKQVKVRVTFSSGWGSATISDEFIRVEVGSSLSVGSQVEARHPDKLDYRSATINKIQDQSQYTVVFDDGDITTLRRNALCMKSGKHYNASESLDNLPLTHPEHFSTPVSRRRKRGAIKETVQDTEDSSSSETEQDGSVSSCYLNNIGRVVWTENTENKKAKSKETWFPALVVAPSASDTVKINTKEEFLIRSFKDGRYYTVRKKDTNQFKKDSPKKSENPLIKEAMEKAISYMETKELPPHWDKEHLFNMGGGGGPEESSSESSESEEIEDDEDEESREEKDHLVAELYKHMEDRGAPINRTPNIVGKDLDLYKLFRIVYKYGGHQRVTNNNKWRQIAHKLGFETTWCVNQVRVNYKRYLQSFEELYKTLGCTMKSGSSTKQRQNSGNGSSGRVQIRGRSREMLKQQLSSSKDSPSEDNAGGDSSSKEDPLPSLTTPEGDSSHDESESKSSMDEVKKELESEEVNSAPGVTEDPKPIVLPSSATKKTAKEKKASTSSGNSSSSSCSSSSSSSSTKSDSSSRKAMKEEALAKPLGTRNRRDSNSSSSSSSQVKAIKEETAAIIPTAKKSLAKELSEIDISKKTPTKADSSDEPGLKTGGGSSTISSSKGGRKKHKESKKAVSSNLNSCSSNSSNNASSSTPTSSGLSSSSSVESASSSSFSISGNNNASSTTEESSLSSSSDGSKSRSSDGEEEAQHLNPDVDVRVGDKIKVFYIRGIIYDAKVIKCQEQAEKKQWPRYYVHYQGWNARYDEWINRSRIAENLSWSKDRPRKDGKDDSSDSDKASSVKKEKTTTTTTTTNSSTSSTNKVDGRKERKIVKRESSSRGSTPGKGSDSPASSSKRGSRSQKKMESDHSDKEEENDSDKKPSSATTPCRGSNKKAFPKRGRGRKRKEESEENEEVDIEKEDGTEEVVSLSSPTKPKRGRKSNKESVPPVVKKEEPTPPVVDEETLGSTVEECSPKKTNSRNTPIREQRPTSSSSSSSRSKLIKESSESKKSSSIIKKEDDSKCDGKGSSSTCVGGIKEVKPTPSSSKEEEDDPYTFKEPEPFEEVKFETPPRKAVLTTPPSTTSTANVSKNLETELSPKALLPIRVAEEKNESIPDEPQQSLPCPLKSISSETKETVVVARSSSPSALIPPSISTSLAHKLEEEEDEEMVEDSDDEGKLEIVTPKKEGPIEELPPNSKSTAATTTSTEEEESDSIHEDECIGMDQELQDSLPAQPSVIIEIKKSPEKPSDLYDDEDDSGGKPVLQLTEKQKELFPFLSAIRTASLGSISASTSTSSQHEGSKSNEPSNQEIKIEVTTTTPSKKPTTSMSSNIDNAIIAIPEKSNSMAAPNKKRKSQRKINSSELVSESDSDDDEVLKAKEPPKDVDSTSSSTKSLSAKKVMILKKDHDADDVDLACAETIPGSPVHPGSSSTDTDGPERGVASIQVTAANSSRSLKSEATKVIEVKKLEMPFATVPESGLEVSSEPPSQIPLATSSVNKKPPPKTETKEHEAPSSVTTMVVISSSPAPSSLPLPSNPIPIPPPAPSIHSTTPQPTASIVTQDNNDLPTTSYIIPPEAPMQSVASFSSPTGGGDSTSDMDSNSGKLKLEEPRLEVGEEEPSNEQQPPSIHHAPITTLTRRNAGLNKRRALADKSSDATHRSPLQKRKRRVRDGTNISGLRYHRGSTRGRIAASGRSVGLRGNLMDEETDESEETKDSTLNSLGSLDDQALIALSQRSPKSSRYNFFVNLDPSMNTTERISLIQENLEELRKTYLNIKTKLAVIERRRKKKRRKERERGGGGGGGSNSINPPSSSSSGSNNSSSSSGASSKSSNPTHIEVTA